MAQLITVRLNKSEHQPLGFRLQGGKDFGTPLVVQKVNGGSAAERAGLQAGDALIRVNNTDVYTLRHQEAQDTIRAAGVNLELTVQRGGGTWRPAVTPTGSLPRPGSRPLGGTPTPVTNTSLKATPQPSRAFGSGHNNVAKPFGYMNGNDSVKSIVNKQYNTPVNIYSDKTIAETLSAQTEVLAGGVLGVNFKKNEKTYDAEKSAVFKVLQEEQNDPEPVEVAPQSTVPPVSGLRHVQAPITRPDAPINNTGGLPPGQNICEECERLITGVFVRIKDKNLHVECFKCSTCGGSLKNQGYYNINGKLYCDIHAKLVARQNPPAPNLEPVTVPPGGRIPTNTYSTPLPPLATNNYSNGSSSLFSPSSNLSGPKPFGSSIGSAYSPSLSPRSAPLSPSRPVAAPAPAPAVAPAPPSAPAPAPFAPTQNVKSIVWPPPNPPEVEQSQYDMMPAMTTKHQNIIKDDINNPHSNKLVQVANMQQQSSQQTMSSDHQMKEYSSNVAITSGSITSMSASSAISESVVQSKQSQMLKETSSCTVKSFSEQTAESQSIIIHHTDMEYDNYNNKIENSEIMNLKSNQESMNLIESAMSVNKQCNSDNKIINASVEQDQSNSRAFINKNDRNLPNPNKTDDPYDYPPEIAKSEQISEKLLQSRDKPNNDNTAFISSEISMVEALKIAPDRPYSPLPSPSPQTVVSIQSNVERKETEGNTQGNITNSTTDEDFQELNAEMLSHTPPIFNQPKRGITPIPPIKTYNPPENNDAPIPMPEETMPYIPLDFKIHIDQKVPRNSNASPFIDALTTAPDRPFTPLINYQLSGTNFERGSLREALTIAPDRPFSPLTHANITSQTNHYTSTSSSSTQVYPTSSEIVRPIATQTSAQMTNQIHSEVSSMQNTCKFQSSSEMSAFKPVGKQAFLTQPQDYYQLTDFSPNTKQIKSDFVESKIKQEINMVSESKTSQESTFYANNMNTQRYSTVKTAQNYFEQLDKKESLTSQAVRSKSGLHKPDNIPQYQKNIEKLPSQRGITPELYNAPAVLQRPVTPSTGPPVKPREKSSEPRSSFITAEMTSQIPQCKTPIQVPIPPPSQSTPIQFYKDTPISMTFQPVSEQGFLRTTPNRSRPSTPSLINKPAPIIPHYQMNLVPIEHLAPESHLYEPSSPEVSRSPTPKPRSKSPAQGPPPNPLKAQAPRVKESTQQHHSSSHTLLSQATTNLRREHESAQNVSQNSLDVYNATETQRWAQQQPSIIKEQKQSNLTYQTENYKKGDTRVREDSMYSQNYDQRELQSQNVSEYGNATVKTTRKTFEEFERTQTAQVIEIRKGGGSSSSGSQQPPGSNIQIYDINAKQNFPTPAMNIPTPNASSYVNHSINPTNENIDPANRVIENYQPKLPISGANHGPVCDPTPSTGSSVGAAARGKTFGVSSAPKRGRGVLNKAALPGSRVPLCASCNGNIRYNVYILNVCFMWSFDFRTVNETLSASSPTKPEFKSAAEERLIRKMAKMALNGYEIGIQRKIKPADHIQSMADKIQDTVVTKHPLNTDSPQDNLSSGESSRDSTLRRSLNTSSDRGMKVPEPNKNTIEKIKENPSSNFNTSLYKSNPPIPPPIPNSPIPSLYSNSPIPPPIPSTPIPVFNIHSTPFGRPLNNEKKLPELTPKNLYSNYDTDLQGEKYIENSSNGSDCSSSEDSHRDKVERNINTNTLKKRNVFEKSTFLNEINISQETKKCEMKFDNNNSNTLNKRRLFEKKDALNGSNNIIDSNNKFNEKSKENLSDSTWNKINNHEQQSVNSIEKMTITDDKQNKELPNLYDNTLYSYKPMTDMNISAPIINIDKVDSTEIKQSFSLENHKENDDQSEEPVKLRKKRNNKNDDGRRDSHIIARPLSTMTSVDVADGLYPVCHKCDKPITRGPFITALGRIWCPEHFICVNATCRRPLQDIGFVEENGQLYCEFCFEQYIAPACDKCHAKIKGDCLNAIGKQFHPECFSCVYCGKLFGNNPFFLEDGLPYCEADWNELFTTKCFACGFPVEAGDRWVEALNNNYHSQCFNCTVCKKNLEGQSFFAKGGRPFCKIHAR